MQYCEQCHRDYPDSIPVCSICGEPLRPVLPLISRKRILSDLDQLPGYKQILENCTLVDDSRTIHFDYIMIHEAGIFAFQLAESCRLLEGTDKMRFWTAAERGQENQPFKIERPVLQLERDQNILEQILRKYFFTKTFAFLLYPEDGGVENVRTNHQDQMLTEPRMYSVLLHMIDTYGYVYNQVGVDKMTELITLLVKNSAPDPQAAGHVRTKHRKGKIAARVFALFIILAVAALAYLYSSGRLDFSSLPSLAPFVDNLKDRLGLHNDLALPSLPAPSPMHVPAIPVEYSALFEAYSEDTLNSLGRKVGFEAVERRADGSILLRMDDDKREEILAAADRIFHEMIDALFASMQLSEITSVRTDDRKRLVLFVASQDFNETDSSVITELARYGMICSVLEDHPPEDFAILLFSQSGQKLNTLTIKDVV